MRSFTHDLCSPSEYAKFVCAGIRQLWIKDKAQKLTGSFTLRRLLENGWIGAADELVINTASGLKYLDVLQKPGT
jgi:hypothetical protein